MSLLPPPPTADGADDSTAPQTADDRPLAVRARGLRLDGTRGRVYGPVDLDLPRGGLTVLTGRAGSGKTALLLTLAGRMRPTAGDLQVLGHDLPRGTRAVQRCTSVMGVAGLDDLDEEVTVGACVRERQAWLAPWYQIVHSPDDATVAEICRPVFGDLPVPRAGDVVHSLPEASDLLLRIALALLSKPALIVVDDIDQIHDTAERDLVWQRLDALAAGGLTVVASAAGTRALGSLAWSRPPLHIPLPETDTASLAAAARS